MKKFSYILISGILGLVLASCAGKVEYKATNIEYADLNITYNGSSTAASHKICFKIDQTIQDESATRNQIGIFASEKGNVDTFCKILYKKDYPTGKATVLIPKYFWYSCDHWNAKCFDGQVGSGNISTYYGNNTTYNVYEAIETGGYRSEVYKTFEVSSSTVKQDLSL